MTDIERIELALRRAANKQYSRAVHSADHITVAIAGALEQAFKDLADSLTNPPEDPK